MSDLFWVMIQGFVCVLEAWVLSDFYTAMLERKTQIQQKIYGLAFFVAYGLLFVVNLQNMPWLNLLTAASINLWLAFYLYQNTWQKKILYMLLWLLVGVLAEFLASAMVNVLTLATPAHWLAFNTARMFSLLIGKFLLFTIIHFIIYRFAQQRDKTISSRYLLGFVAITFFSLILMNSIFYFAIHLPLIQLPNLFIVIALCLVIINMVFYSFFQRAVTADKKELENLVLENAAQMVNQYLSLTHAKYEQMQIQIHDSKKHLAVVRMLADQLQSQELTDYLDQIAGEYRALDVQYVTGNKVVDIILTDKRQHALAQNIHCSFGAQTVDFTLVDATDLCHILANLLDNAIEASVQSPAKWIELTIGRRNPYMAFCKVINSCGQPPKAHGEQLLSTKKASGHGWGIRSVEMTLAKYGGHFSWHYQPETQVFTAMVLLPLTPLATG